MQKSGGVPEETLYRVSTEDLMTSFSMTHTGRLRESPQRTKHQSFLIPSRWSWSTFHGLICCLVLKSCLPVWPPKGLHYCCLRSLTRDRAGGNYFCQPPAWAIVIAMVELSFLFRLQRSFTTLTAGHMLRSWRGSTMIVGGLLIYIQDGLCLLAPWDAWP